MKISEHLGRILVEIRELKDHKHITEPDEFVKVEAIISAVDEAMITFEHKIESSSD